MNKEKPINKIFFIILGLVVVYHPSRTGDAAMNIGCVNEEQVPTTRDIHINKICYIHKHFSASRNGCAAGVLLHIVGVDSAGATDK